MKKINALMLGVGACLALSACSNNEEAQIEARMEQVATFMAEEMDPTVDGIWDHAGWVLTDEGEESLFPKTDEEWAAVAQAANNLIAQTRRLQQPEFAAGDEEWIAISEGLVVAASLVTEAVDDRNEDELFDAGGQIYRVCLACHQRYAMDAGAL